MTSINHDASSDANTVVRCRKLLVVCSIVVLAHLPLSLIHLRNIWQRPHYQFFPLLILASLLLLWRSRPTESVGYRASTRRGATLLLAAGVLLLVVAILVYSPWLAMAGTLLTTGGLLTYYAGDRFFTDMLTAWLLLFLILPPPFDLDWRLIERMQSATTMTASRVLELFDVPHLVEGFVIEIPGRRLFVEEACSGVHSLFSLFALAAVFVVWKKVPLLAAILLLGAAVFWAVMTNLGRVVTVPYVMSHWWVDLSTGWRHELLGICFFALALLMLLSFDRLLVPIMSGSYGFIYWAIDFLPRGIRWRFSKLGELESAQEPSARDSNSAFGLLNSWFVAGLCGCLVALQLTLF